MEWPERIEVIDKIKKRLIDTSLVKDEAWAYEVARRWAR
jgi:hypothetical protein